ncbi:hypothetical protein Tco_0305071 [Tanacetum coccineum]
MVINSPCLTDKKQLAIPGQTATGKEFSNPLIADSLPKTINGSPRRQETMGGTPNQTRSERVLAQPNEPPLLKGHTSRSGEDKMEHQFELTANVPITPHDSPLLGGYTPGSDKGSMKLLSKQVLDLEIAKDA